MLKAKDLRKMDISELEQKLVELKTTYSKEYVATKVGSKGEKAVNLRNIRKDIARVKTVLNLKKKGQQ